MSTEIRSLNEECGVFGIWNYPDAAQTTYYGLHSLQHRGQEGAGIASSDGEKIYRYRNIGLLSDVFSDKSTMDILKGDAAIGHVRYSTAGEKRVRNIQPFVFHFKNSSLGLAHNGNLINAESLKEELEEQGSIFQSSSDTEIIAHVIQRGKSPDFMENLKAALRQVKGGFAYLILTQEAMYCALDENGFRPLSIGVIGDGTYVVASETCAFDSVGATFLRDVVPGEVIKFDKDGMHVDRYTDKIQYSICSMEYVYFARPDSNIAGVNVHEARIRMGQNLYKEHDIDADIVIGVPDSSISAAMGFAEASGLPYQIGLIKNRYVARTFIQPTQELRERGVRMKLSVIRSVVANKRIVLIDDSIVRGTTTARIVRLLKEYGAKEVHVRIASPPLQYPCYYGIDIQSFDELIAAKHSVDEICKIIGADSLKFLSVDGLVDAIGKPYPDQKYGGVTMAYFNGDYPTPLYDFEEQHKKALQVLKEKGASL